MNNKTILPSEQYIKTYLEKNILIPLKFEKKHIQKEIVNKYKFKTHEAYDTDYRTILEAEESIDRKDSVLKILKYVNEYNLANEIENGLFEYSLIHITTTNQPFNLISNIYYHHLITICRNLDINDTGVENKTLLPMIIENILNPFFVAFLKPEQMHPERWKNIIDKKKVEEETENGFQTTDIYTCKKCKDKRFKITEVQLRGLDECSSKIVTCMTCYYTFVIN
jgi:DNA-directed RNA polymerase subunit M/transcription elongation factor TFIIS